jgi:hypothetical protein
MRCNTIYGKFRRQIGKWRTRIENGGLLYLQGKSGKIIVAQNTIFRGQVFGTAMPSGDCLHCAGIFLLMKSPFLFDCPYPLLVEGDKNISPSPQSLPTSSLLHLPSNLAQSIPLYSARASCRTYQPPSACQLTFFSFIYTAFPILVQLTSIFRASHYKIA